MASDLRARDAQAQRFAATRPFALAGGTDPIPTTTSTPTCAVCLADGPRPRWLARCLLRAAQPFRSWRCAPRCAPNPDTPGKAHATTSSARCHRASKSTAHGPYRETVPRIIIATRASPRLRGTTHSAADLVGRKLAWRAASSSRSDRDIAHGARISPSSSTRRRLRASGRMVSATPATVSQAASYLTMLATRRRLLCFENRRRRARLRQRRPRFLEQNRFARFICNNRPRATACPRAAGTPRSSRCRIA